RYQCCADQIHLESGSFITTFIEIFHKLSLLKTN
ncbi:MAG: hypothetical protein ACI8XG_000820, partial [Congregibacter sp.]